METFNIRFVINVGSVTELAKARDLARLLIDEGSQAGVDITEPKYVGASSQINSVAAYFDCIDLDFGAASWLRYRTDGKLMP